MLLAPRSTAGEEDEDLVAKSSAIDYVIILANSEASAPACSTDALINQSIVYFSVILLVSPTV